MNHPVPIEGAAGTPVEPEALRRRIAYTRDELAETVEALTAKADVKARAAHAAIGAADSVTGELHAVERAVATGYRSLAGRTSRVFPAGLARRAWRRVAARTSRRKLAVPQAAGLLVAGVTTLFVAVAARRRRR